MVVYGLACQGCGHEYRAERQLERCPRCDSPGRVLNARATVPARRG